MVFISNLFKKLVKSKDDGSKIKKKINPFVQKDTDPFTMWKNVGELGDGAFGKVFKAEHKTSQRNAALKQVEFENDEDLEDLMVEIDILTLCKHRNIVDLFEAYMHEGKVWMYIEFCGGGAIDSLMMELEKPLTEPQIRYVAHEMCEALSFLHSHYIIHRDLKAGNVLLTLDGEVKLADFGVSAKNRDDKQRRDTYIGTPYWMAPEVIACEMFKDQPYDQMADIWSLAITLIEFAETKPPNSEMHPMRVGIKIQKSEPPKLKKASEWSAEFHVFLKKCLWKLPSARSTAEQLLEDPFIKNIKVEDNLPIRQLISEAKAEVIETLEETDLSMRNSITSYDSTESEAITTDDEGRCHAESSLDVSQVTEEDLKATVNNLLELVIEAAAIEDQSIISVVLETKQEHLDEIYATVEIGFSKPSAEIAAVINQVDTGPSISASSTEPNILGAVKELAEEDKAEEDMNQHDNGIKSEIETIDDVESDRAKVEDNDIGTEKSEKNEEIKIDDQDLEKEMENGKIVESEDASQRDKESESKDVEESEHRKEDNEEKDDNPMIVDDKETQGVIQTISVDREAKEDEEELKHQELAIAEDSPIKEDDQTTAGTKEMKNEDHTIVCDEKTKEIPTIAEDSEKNGDDNLIDAGETKEEKHAIVDHEEMNDHTAKDEDAKEAEQIIIEDGGTKGDHAVEDEEIKEAEHAIVEDGGAKDDHVAQEEETKEEELAIEDDEVKKEEELAIEDDESARDNHAAEEERAIEDVETMKEDEPTIADEKERKDDNVVEDEETKEAALVIVDKEKKDNLTVGEETQEAGNAIEDDVSKDAGRSKGVAEVDTPKENNEIDVKDAVVSGDDAVAKEEKSTPKSEKDEGQGHEEHESTSASDACEITDLDAQEDDGVKNESQEKGDQRKKVPASPVRRVPKADGAGDGGEVVIRRRPPKNDTTKRQCKTLKRVRKFTIDGQEYTTTTKRKVTDSRDDMKRHREYLNRKMAMREVKRLQIMEQHENRELSARQDTQRDELDVRLRQEELTLRRNQEQELDSLQRHHRTLLDRAEADHSSLLKVSTRRIRGDQDREIRRFRESLKTEKKVLKHEVDNLPKARRKEEFRRRMDTKDEEFSSREKKFLEELQSRMNSELSRLQVKFSDATDTLEEECLQECHEKRKQHDDSRGELQLRHLQMRHSQVREHHQEMYRLKRQQNERRQELERSLLQKSLAKEEAELVAAQNDDLKQLPKLKARDMKVRQEIFRQSLLIPGRTCAPEEERDRIRAFEDSERERVKSEIEAQERRYQRRLQTLTLQHQLHLSELQEIHAEKQKQLLDQETMKMGELQETFRKQVEAKTEDLDSLHKFLLRELSMESRNKGSSIRQRSNSLASMRSFRGSLFS